MYESTHSSRRLETTTQRSRVMAAVRSNGNKSTEERLVRIMRWHHITGWCRNWPLLGKPDFVFPKHKLVVFVDGCFWHGCPRCYREPKGNVEYWREKISHNISRDRKNLRLLKMMGWHALRIWEHALNNDTAVARRIMKAISRHEG